MMWKALVPAALATALCAARAPAQDVSFGERIFQDKADCQFCHGPDGDGRGDPRSPGKAANLHETKLTREQLIEVIACGRPGSEMPHFDKFAYEDRKCYGLSAAQVGNLMPPPPHSTSLVQREIAAVADYILTKFVGK
jgi:mono/diheme cytochrome c family protein